MRSLPTIRVVGNPVASRDGTRTRNLPFKLGCINLAKSHKAIVLHASGR